MIAFAIDVFLFHGNSFCIHIDKSLHISILFNLDRTLWFCSDVQFSFTLYAVEIGNGEKEIYHSINSFFVFKCSFYPVSGFLIILYAKTDVKRTQLDRKIESVFFFRERSSDDNRKNPCKRVIQ